MADPHPILSEIDAFLATPGIDISPTAFGIAVMNDGKWLSALRNGRWVRPETERKVRAFIKAEKQRRILALGGKIDEAA